MLATLAEAVGGRSLLVVLDNCEHVIDACVKVADALLRACPNLRLLATSRERWALAGNGCTGCRRWVSRPTAMTPG